MLIDIYITLVAHLQGQAIELGVLGLVDPEDEGDTFLLHVDDYLLTDMA
jgi:hypothetical protein